MLEQWICYHTSGTQTIHKYYVSNFGRIKKDGTLIEPLKCHERYYGAPGTNKFLHQIVAKYFCKKPNEECIYVDHMDRNRYNNKASNLRWVTPKENTHNSKRYLINEALGKHKILTSEEKAARKKKLLQKSWQILKEKGYKGANFGKKFSEDTKSKMSASHKNNGITYEWRKKYFYITYIDEKLQNKYNIDLSKKYYMSELKQIIKAANYYITKKKIQIEYI